MILCEYDTMTPCRQLDRLILEIQNLDKNSQNLESYKLNINSLTNFNRTNSFSTFSVCCRLSALHASAHGRIADSQQELLQKITLKYR